MRYIKHNLYSNMDAAVRYKDTEALRNMFVDQVSEIIANQPVRLISAMTDSGIEVSVKPTNRELINKVVLNIDKNPKFKSKLADIIASGGGKADQKKYSANGQITAAPSGSEVVANAVDQVFTGDVKNVKQQTTTDLVNSLSNKGRDAESGSGNGRTVLLIAAFAGIIYLLNKKQ